MRVKQLFAAALALLVLAANASSPLAFVAGSYSSLLAAHQGRPFILALWSLDCPPCRRELAQLGMLRARYPRLDVVLVCTDIQVSAAEIAGVLHEHNLDNVESWVFSATFEQRLRYEIDPAWEGELPRSYFIGDDGGSVRAISGVIDPAWLIEWAERMPASMQ